MSAAPANRLPGIEVLRGVAAAIVIFSHAARHIDKVRGAPGLITAFQAGHAGVDLFFVISGFIILHVHHADIGRPARLPRYALRRFVRIFPLYWIVLALSIAMAAANHGLPGPGDALWSFGLLPSRAEPLLGIAWTLQFELVFYVAFAALILHRAAGVLAMAGWAAVMMAALLGLPGLGVPGLGVPGLGAVPVLSSPYGAEFLVGMLAAGLVRRGRVAAPRATALSGGLLFAGMLGLDSMGVLDGAAPVARLAFGIPAGLLVAGLASLDQVERVAYPRLLRVLGSASYSLYLWQFVFIGAVWQALLRTGLADAVPNMPLFAMLAGAALVGGVVASRAVEMPLLRWMQGRLRRVERPAGASLAAGR